jgi:hypothetical protein
VVGLAGGMKKILLGIERVGTPIIIRVGEGEYLWVDGETDIYY